MKQRVKPNMSTQAQAQLYKEMVQEFGGGRDECDISTIKYGDNDDYDLNDAFIDDQTLDLNDLSNMDTVELEDEKSDIDDDNIKLKALLSTVMETQYMRQQNLQIREMFDLTTYLKSTDNGIPLTAQNILEISEYFQKVNIAKQRMKICEENENTQYSPREIVIIETLFEINNKNCVGPFKDFDIKLARIRVDNNQTETRLASSYWDDIPEHIFLHFLMSTNMPLITYVYVYRLVTNITCTNKYQR